MGREVKRVPLDFDWPQGKTWPGFMGGICTDAIGYCIGDKDAELETMCKACRHFGRLAGILDKPDGCPKTTFDPPTGDGWQLWETVSEGSPVTDVYSTAEDLALHLSKGGGRPLGAPPTYDQALAFVNKGWAPSMVVAGQGVESGVNYVGRTAIKEG